MSETIIFAGLAFSVFALAFGEGDAAFFIMLAALAIGGLTK